MLLLLLLLLATWCLQENGVKPEYGLAEAGKQQAEAAGYESAIHGWKHTSRPQHSRVVYQAPLRCLSKAARIRLAMRKDTNSNIQPPLQSS
jgi:hypothetical protein